MAKNSEYLVEIGGLCENEETGKEKTLWVPFLFKSEESCEMASGDSFDTLYEAFEEWLQQHGRKGWAPMDVLGQGHHLRGAIDPVIVTNY